MSLMYTIPIFNKEVFQNMYLIIVSEKKGWHLL